MVDIPLPAVIGDVAATADRTADTPSELTTTVAVCVTATALIVADTVFASATVELSAPVATPLTFVVPTGWVSVFPTPVAARITVAAVIGEVAASADCAPETVPTVTTTVAVCVRASPLIVAETVFDSATVELSIPVATPLALVGPAGCVRVLAVPVAASTTVAPLMGLPNPSRAVTVIVEVALPAAISDVDLMITRVDSRHSAVTTTGAG